MTPGVLVPQGSSLEGDASGVLATTLPRPIAAPRRRFISPFISVSVSSLSGWQPLSCAPELEYLGQLCVAPSQMANRGPTGFSCLRTRGFLGSRPNSPLLTDSQ